VKKKLEKNIRGEWDTSDLYRQGASPFIVDWVKFFNPKEGRDMVAFIYSDKESGRIMKYRILR